LQIDLDGQPSPMARSTAEALLLDDALGRIVQARWAIGRFSQ
jgi:hypothetical protein